MSNPQPPLAGHPTLYPSIAFVLTGVALALAFVVATDKFGATVSSIKHTRPEIVVKGVATLDQRSGEGMINAQLSWRGTDFAVGRAALAAQREALLKVVRQQGFTPAEITIAAPQSQKLEPALYVEPVYSPEDKTPRPRLPQQIDTTRFAKGKVPEYTFNQSIMLESSDVARITRFSLTEIFLETDVELNRSTPVFRLTNLPESKKELLELAAKDANRRASTMIAGSGSRLGALLEASQGVIQISPKGRSGEFDSGTVDYESIEKTIRVVVTMRFEILRD